jgi:hypothetical protein
MAKQLKLLLRLDQSARWRAKQGDGVKNMVSFYPLNINQTCHIIVRYKTK